MPDDTQTAPASRLGDDEARAATIAERTAKEKAALIEQLRRTPIIQIACEKTGVSRQTFYRWRKDASFAQAADDALSDGRMLVNDLAESQLLTALRNGDPWSIQYWLRNNHAGYSNKLEITAKAPPETLTPEQQDQLNRALTFAGLLTPESDSGTPFISSSANNENPQ
ncbi:MAG: hypothetical protein PHZ00_06235 [Candidatus Peribacteraceae bacterium]|nr:hypothetical protein [Candidatus Peribacteraceae bacterium]